MSTDGKAGLPWPDIVERCQQPSSDPMRREAAEEIIRLRQQVKLLTEDIAVRDVGYEDMKVGLEEEITRLRQQVQELEARVSFDDELISTAFDSADTLEEQLAASQAREAKLREVLNSIWMNCALRVDSIKHATKEALALPQDDTALKEYRKQVLLEAAKSFTYFNDAGDVLRELRRMAEEE